MATLDVEDRKRPLDPEVRSEITSVTKRPHLDRANSSFISNGSPIDIKNGQNGEEEEEDIIPAYKGLEAFRKEAIFRKMRESQRELARAQTKVRQLQNQVDQTDEKCAALNTFWNTLVEDVQILIQEGKIPDETHSAFTDAIELSVSKPSPSAFSKSLEERNASMKAILGMIVRLTPGSSPDVDELQAKCHQLAVDSASLRARYHLTSQDRDSLVDELDITIEKLRKFERLHDRMHSSTVKATERPGAEAEEEAERAKVEAAEVERQAAVKRKQVAENELQDGASVNGINTHASAELAQELEDAQKLAESRLVELDEWRNQVVILRQENEALKMELQNIPQEKLVASDLYRQLHHQFEHAGEEHVRLKSVNERLESENVELREQRQEYEAKAKDEANSLVDELRNAVKTHEGDVARLRSQRDELMAELTEKKQRETVKYTQVDEMKTLVQVKEKRINTLGAEIRRLQISLAARLGDDVWMAKLKASLTDEEKEQADADTELFSDLQSRLKSAEERIADLQRQQEARSSSTTEADLLAKVSTLQKELQELKAILDQAGETPESISTLLQKQHEELQKSKRELDTANASTTALCDELDKLGAAYNEAQNIASTRIADLGRMEEKLSRLTTEKAKADNKYFSAMRAKDAIENEKRVALRNVERQIRVVEKYTELESDRKEQISKLESEVTEFRRYANESNAKLANLQSSMNMMQDQLNRSIEARDQAIAISREKTQEVMEEAKQRSSAQERCEKLQRDLDKVRKQLASSGGTRKKGSFADDDQIEALNSLLRCSSCKDRYRNRIITRCLHTFCNDCVDARIQTRQRKCPSCGLGFSTSDVQTLFFQ
ncbi:hypothetical protein L7F22_039145 [Adiantum nelumboides]|nr:hypothetical protein [Adiantum nelumboides]